MRYLLRSLRRVEICKAGGRHRGRRKRRRKGLLHAGRLERLLRKLQAALHRMQGRFIRDRANRFLQSVAEIGLCLILCAHGIQGLPALRIARADNPLLQRLQPQLLCAGRIQAGCKLHRFILRPMQRTQLSAHLLQARRELRNASGATGKPVFQAAQLLLQL